MVTSGSANRALTKVEIDTDLGKLEYDAESLESMLAKYGLETTHAETSWKKSQIDYFRDQIAKERKDLDDVFAINLKLNREEFKKLEELELAKQIFVRKEKYYNLEQKIFRLLNVIKILDKKAQAIIDSMKKIKTSVKKPEQTNL